jgi:hypothetical protein
VMAIRSGDESLFRVGPLSNKLLLGGGRPGVRLATAGYLRSLLPEIP